MMMMMMTMSGSVRDEVKTVMNTIETDYCCELLSCQVFSDQTILD